jgi:uncharacterized alkaline shock family protein YloU
MDDSTQGRIDVSPKVIAGIAAEAVMSCYGVVGMASATLSDDIAELLTGDSVHRGIEVRLVNGRIAIELHVIVEYGTRISEVAQNVMRAVKFSVEHSLGMPVEHVNVEIRGLRVSNND